MNRTNSTFAAVVAADKRYESFILVMSSKQTLPVKLFLGILKGSSDPNHFIFELNVGKRRIRHRTTLKLIF